MTKKQAIQWIKVHTFNGDDGLAMRVYIENRISMKAYREAQTLGHQLRQAHLKKQQEQPVTA